MCLSIYFFLSLNKMQLLCQNVTSELRLASILEGSHICSRIMQHFQLTNLFYKVNGMETLRKGDRKVG